MPKGYARLHVLNFGVAVGVVLAVYFFALALFALMYGVGGEFIEVSSTFYKGYEASFLGAIIGAVWGFIDGFLFGVVFSWLYNSLL